MTTAPTVERLATGMRAVLLPSDANNIATVAIFLPLPGAIEQPREAGLVQFTHKMLMRGTTVRGAAELAECIEALGTSISCDAADDYSHAHMICTADAFRPSMELLAEVMQKPSFEPEEIEKERQSTIASIRRAEDDKFSFTMKRFIRELYGAHSYALPRTGEVETVAEFRREQLQEVHAEGFDPANFLAVCVGRFQPGEARELLESLFPARGGAQEAFSVPAFVSPGPRSARLSRDCEQAYLAMGFPACPAGSTDFPAARVLSAVLGESMSSRFFIRLRDEQGLAYSTGCSLGAFRMGGHLVGYIGTKPESLETARDGMAKIFAEIRDTLVPEGELERAKNYIVGKFLIDHQTNYRRAFYLGHYEMTGLGLERDEQLPAIIAAVTAEQVREAANRYLTGPTVVELVPNATADPVARASRP